MPRGELLFSERATRSPPSPSTAKDGYRESVGPGSIGILASGVGRASTPIRAGRIVRITSESATSATERIRLAGAETERRSAALAGAPEAPSSTQAASVSGTKRHPRAPRTDCYHTAPVFSVSIIEDNQERPLIYSGAG